MHTALRRGKYFKSTGRLKPFCTVDFPHSGKEANQNKQTNKNKTLREVHESDGNATVMPPSYAPDSTGHAVTAGRGSSGYTIIFIFAKIA